MIDEKDVSATSLREVLLAAFMDVTEVQGNGFKAKGVQFPFFLNVNIEPDQKLVSLTDFNLLHRVSHAEALNLCNEASKNFGPARFFVVEHETGLLQVAQYQLPYERGLLPYHLFVSFRAFEQCVGSAIRGLFKDHLKP